MLRNLALWQHTINGYLHSKALSLHAQKPLNMVTPRLANYVMHDLTLRVDIIWHRSIRTLPYKVTIISGQVKNAVFDMYMYRGIGASPAGPVLAGPHLLNILAHTLRAHLIQPDHFKSPSYAPDVPFRSLRMRSVLQLSS